MVTYAQIGLDTPAYSSGVNVAHRTTRRQGSGRGHPPREHPLLPRRGDLGPNRYLLVWPERTGSAQQKLCRHTVAYTAEALRIRVTVVDYYLWYKVSPTATDDLTHYDAVAIYLDTGFDRAATPQTALFIVDARQLWLPPVLQSR